MSDMYLASLGFFLFFLTISICLALLVASLFPSGSQRYRKYLTNLYVSARVRQLAKEDDLDLEVEEVLFKKHDRSGGRSERDLDKTIEEDLKVRVEEAYDKEKSKKAIVKKSTNKEESKD